MKIFFNHLIRYFLSGLFVVLPLVATILVIAWLVGVIGEFFGPSSFLGSLWLALFRLLPFGEIGSSVVGYFAIVLLIAAIGYYAKGFVTQRILALIRGFCDQIPVVNKIYRSVEQVVSLWKHKEQGEELGKIGEVVIVNFANARIFGILSSPKVYTINGEGHHLVFIASAPVPATGFTYFIKTSDVIRCDIGIEQMSKVLISLGVLGPEVLPGELGKVKVNNQMINDARIT